MFFFGATKVAFYRLSCKFYTPKSKIYLTPPTTPESPLMSPRFLTRGSAVWSGPVLIVMYSGIMGAWWVAGVCRAHCARGGQGRVRTLWRMYWRW